MAEKIIFKRVKGRLKDDEFVFEEPGLCLIGRSSDSALRISKEEDMRISRRHCLLILDPPKIRIRDLGSRNGTYVNDDRLEAGTLGEDPRTLTPVDRVLKHGDEISLGETVFSVCIPSVAPEGGEKALPPGTKIIKLSKPASQKASVKRSKPIDTGFFGVPAPGSPTSTASSMTELIPRGAFIDDGDSPTEAQSKPIPLASPKKAGSTLELKVQSDDQAPVAAPVPPPLEEALTSQPEQPPAAPVRLAPKKPSQAVEGQPEQKPLKARIVRKPSAAKPSPPPAKPSLDGTEIMDVPELADDTALGKEYKRAERSGKRITKFRVKKNKK